MREAAAPDRQEVVAVFVARLRTAMDKTGIETATELADRLGGAGYVRSCYVWLSGESLPRAEQLPHIARTLGVSVDWLLGMDEPPSEGQWLAQAIEAASEDGDRPWLAFVDEDAEVLRWPIGWDVIAARAHEWYESEGEEVTPPDWVIARTMTIARWVAERTNEELRWGELRWLLYHVRPETELSAEECGERLAAVRGKMADLKEAWQRGEGERRE